MIWNLVTKTCPKFVTFRFFFSILNKIEKRKKIEEFFLPFCFVNNFSELLFFEINVFDISNMVNFFCFFVVQRSIEILIKPNFWLGMYIVKLMDNTVHNVIYRTIKLTNVTHQIKVGTGNLNDC